MRPDSVTAIIGLAVLFAGCASQKPSIITGTVGPAPPLASGAAVGSLVVYSAHDPTSDFNDVPFLSRYTDYRILSNGGRLLETVQNNTGGVIEQPARVQLPEGAYRVVAQANGYKNVVVPVVIRADRITTVRLEGGGSWPDNAALVQSNPVRLPTGEIVGWRANSEALSKR